MKQVLVNSLISLAKKNRNLYFLTGDLGYPHFTKFARLFPNQYINMGIAEQNMISVSAGLALAGKNVWIYSIIPFATMRCFEQVRNDLCYHNLNVKIIGFGTGFTYSTHGVTHYGIEDVALMRALPNIIILSPANDTEAKRCFRIAYDYQGPAYIRLGKNEADSTDRHVIKPFFKLGQGLVFNDGKDLSLISTGTFMSKACAVAARLHQQRLSVRLISLPCLKPVDKKLILDAAVKTKAIVTLEEHSLIGGLGSIVGEVLLDEHLGNIRLVRIGLADQYPKKVCSREYLLEKAGLSVNQIVRKIIINLPLSLKSIIS